MKIKAAAEFVTSLLAKLKRRETEDQQATEDQAKQ